MTPPRRSGRPRASSWAVLEEAAGELFLERGYARTSVVDITRRAGVSRNTFFNYFSTKSDLLWTAFDSTFGELADALVRTRGADPDEVVRHALLELAAELPPENVALAYGQAEPMGLDEELRHAASLRVGTVGSVIRRHAVEAGVERVRAEVAGTAYAGALIAAIGAWSRAGASRHSLPEILTEAWEPLVGLLRSA
ncbi:TetR/AcrR family transcriptional regulator [Pseudactinotalea sp. Z1748]|uniref:TetR/AcrR family transcriptional regulator n=1 Tax=Pseudactinotalea sp. Z1748 TaxID=3413027 RepID=UPI003C7DAED8